MSGAFSVPLPIVLLCNLSQLSVASIEASSAVSETFAHSDHMNFISSSLLPVLVLEEQAGEDLLETLSEMLGNQRIDDRVEAGISIRKAVGSQAAGISGSVEREVAKPEAQDNQMVWKPAEAEQDGHSHDHLGDLTLGLSGL